MTEISTDLQNPVMTTASTTTHENDQHRDGLGFWKFMLAGSVAGMVEHMAMFPVDTLKTRMQMLGAAPSSSCAAAAASSSHSHHQIGRLLASIMRTEGPLGLYRGIGAMGLGAGPAHAVHFSVYETCKEKLGGNRTGHHPLVHAASGVIATTASDAVLTPMDVVKQRLQLRSSPYGGVKDCVVRMFKEEGFRAFYASYRTTIVMNAPFTAVYFATYEAAKKVLNEISPENASEEQLMVHVLAGGAAGALAGAVTTPLDVVKTRLQCQGVCGADKFRSSSIRMAVKQIVAREGPQALLRGLKPRVLFHAPAAAICWSTYEAMKSFLQHVPEGHPSQP
ncbi:Mitochondrial carrier protein [Macleaya cordata]|uniref:Mitochondrial carrier protein n=1 Tax=Macleaya cordata TaxID=56857 RepID=A0A200R2N4_MACCD|nr:Mitochondrial carrier protein [Macleaya cordata]